MAKRWLPDGTIAPYDNALQFRESTREVDGIASLSALLTELETQPRACIIRGTFNGMVVAAALPRFEDRFTRRSKEHFSDQPLHSVCFDIDDYEPLMFDPVADAADAVAEFIQLVLPACFGTAGYHWQLSNSAGHPSKARKLKAHVWFWLETAATSAELSAWARRLGLDRDAGGAGCKIDGSLMDAVHIHYTSLPLMGEGMVDPVLAGGWARSGFVAGLMDDAVGLDVGAELSALGAVGIGDFGIGRGGGGGGGGGGVHGRLMREEPLYVALAEKGLIIDWNQNDKGALDICCPLAHEHSDGGADAWRRTVTVAYGANTGGYVHACIKCLHACHEHLPQRRYRQALGMIEADEAGFEAIPIYERRGPLPLLSDLNQDIPAEHKMPTGEGTASAADLDPDQIRKQVDVLTAQHLTTDLSNVSRLIMKGGGSYIVYGGAWYYWSGVRWVQNKDKIHTYSYGLSAMIKAEAEAWEDRRQSLERVGSDDEIAICADNAKRLYKWSAVSESSVATHACVRMLEHYLGVAETRLDADPWLMTCLNGTVDLRTGILKPNSHANYITKCTGLNYDPDAKCPLWEATLLKICQEDGMVGAGRATPLVSFLQRWFGYCATGSVREQKMVVHWGGGANGKSTVIDTVASVLGTYADTAAPGLIVATKVERHPAEIIDLRGKRLITAHETEEGTYLREAFIKQATGGDKLKGRAMYGSFEEFAPSSKLQLLTNHKPAIKGQDVGIWRRLLLVPYLASFGSSDEVACGQRKYLGDPRLTERLMAEYEGILAWIVRGAVAWGVGGLQAPDSVLAASQGYQADQDRTLRFTNECCDIGHEYQAVLSGDFYGLYPEYQKWCKESGTFPLSKPRFLEDLKRIVPGFEDTQDARLGPEENYKRVRVVKGLRLRSYL